MSAIHDKQVSQEKKEIVASLKEELTSAKGAVLTSYKGLTVAQDTQLRRALREAGVSYHVVKNTLTTIAAKEAGMDAYITKPLDVQKMMRTIANVLADDSKD